MGSIPIRNSSFCGIAQQVAHRVHTPEVGGSKPPPASRTSRALFAWGLGPSRFAKPHSKIGSGRNPCPAKQNLRKVGRAVMQRFAKPWLRKRLAGSIPAPSARFSSESLAQLAERWSPKPKVRGSIPWWLANFLLAPSSIGRAPDFDSGGSWFETKGVCHLHAALAQLDKSTTLRTSGSGVRISRAAPQKDFGLRAALATATHLGKSVLLRDTTGFDSLAIHQNDVPR